MKEWWWAVLYEDVVEPVEVQFREDGSIDEIRAIGLDGAYGPAEDQLIEPLGQAPKGYSLMSGLAPKSEFATADHTGRTRAVQLALALVPEPDADRPPVAAVEPRWSPSFGRPDDTRH